MLNKRAQILFDERTYRSLREIAREKKSSVGELVRTAVKKVYRKTKETKKTISLAEVAKETYGAWKNQALKKSDLASPLSGRWTEPDKVFGY